MRGGLQIIYRTESLWNENELNIQLFLLVCDKDRVLAAKLNDNLIEKRLYTCILARIVK